jgi:hypothetical protein
MNEKKELKYQEDIWISDLAWYYHTQTDRGSMK